MSHTKGDWKINKFQWNDIDVCVDENNPVCNIYDTGKAKENEANAKLIAAAPKTAKRLSEVYIHLLNNMDGDVRFTTQGQAMLAGIVGDLADSYGMTQQECQEWHESKAFKLRS